MNKTFFRMCAMMLPVAALAGCNSTGSDKEKIIEKPDIKVVDGRLTPEVLEAFGRISEAVPSPDGKKVIFTLTY